MQTNLPKKKRWTETVSAAFGHTDSQVTFSSDRMEPNRKLCVKRMIKWHQPQCNIKLLTCFIKYSDNMIHGCQ